MAASFQPLLLQQPQRRRQPAWTLMVTAWLLFFTTTVLAQTNVFSTNSTTWNPGNNKQFMLELTQTAEDPNHIIMVQPLNNASYTVLPTSENSASGLQGNLMLGSASSSDADTTQTIIVLNCDNNFYGAGDVDVETLTANAIAANVTAIVFYSLQENYCNATGFEFNRLYSTTNTNDGLTLNLSGYTNANTAPASMIWTNQAFQNYFFSPTGSNTQIAMIVLYSITGVITALFLFIIITGAFRAHRHPERYGPRNIIGGTRQSRARGIARAMLDTIPIVKFGDALAPAPAPASRDAKDRDLEQNISSVSGAPVELQEVAGERTLSGADKKEGTIHEVASAASSRAEDASGHNSDDEGIAAGTTANVNDENPGCSICTEDFERGQDIRVLPCNHKFHPACVDPWLLDVSGTCPLCRIDLRPSTNPEETANSDQLPPPLDSNTNEARRMSTLKTLFMFNRGSLQNASAEERILALRRFRDMHRGRANTNNATEGSSSAAAAADESANSGSNTGSALIGRLLRGRKTGTTGTSSTTMSSTAAGVSAMSPTVEDVAEQDDAEATTAAANSTTHQHTHTHIHTHTHTHDHESSTNEGSSAPPS